MIKDSENLENLSFEDALMKLEKQKKKEQKNA